MPSEDHLFQVTYDDLRRIAVAASRQPSAPVLVPKCLVNEAWQNLKKTPELASASELHFKQIAARAMRRLISTANKRVVFNDGLQTIECSEEQLLALDMELEHLSQTNPRRTALIEGRFFGGLEIGEMATLLGVSENSILVEWRAARAWLSRHLRCEYSDRQATNGPMS